MNEDFEDGELYLERERRDNKQGNDFNGDKTRKIMIALAAVAAVLLIVLAVVWISKASLVKQLNGEKEELTAELVGLQNDYETLQTTNQAINDSLTVEKEKVGQLIERLEQTNATNRAKIRQYEKELGTLRTIMKSYIVQIDSLNNLNTRLRREAREAKAEAEQNKTLYQEAQATADAYAKQVSEGSVVKGRGFSLVAINSSNKETDRSSRVVKLKACLSLIENTLAETGYRTIYIRVKGPDGVLMSNDPTNVFELNGDQMLYSASREVDYQGDEVEICIYFESQQQFAKGVYTVDIYSNETMLGSADVLLK